MRAIVAIVVLCSTVVSHAAEFYKIDPAHTYPYFAVSHLGFSTLYGRFDMTTGQIVMDREHDNGSVNLEISAVSISTGHRKRDKHLRSPDFFNVMEFPDIVYKSTKVHFEGTNKIQVQGELSLLGVTRSVPLSVTRVTCGQHPVNHKATCGFEASTQIKRSDFGMTFGLPGVGDIVKLWFQVEAYKEE